MHNCLGNRFPGASVAMGGVLLLVATVAQAGQNTSPPDLLDFLRLASVDDEEMAEEAIDRISTSWRDGYAGMVWDILRLQQPPRPPRPLPQSVDGATSPFTTGVQSFVEPEHPSTAVFRRLIRLLEDRAGERFGNDVNRWQAWIWGLPYNPHPDYEVFKALWYGQLDPRFREFFPRDVVSTVRLDEVDWGGVRPNAIPPLEYPTPMPAADADYLDDDDVVFGVAVDGEPRAYPKRILAWHEMALDRVGGLELTIVYCTLCGTVIPYESVVDGQHHRFGTSGLLYRSNKLMFDHDTNSLWNTLEGVPVIGPLVDADVRLTRRSLVTTTWGEWRRRHPKTTVLSLDTGHTRDYSEGAAYREYFSHDRLMFEVSARDDRLDNKDEVVVMLLNRPEEAERQPVALSAAFLKDRPVFQTEVVGHAFVVVTSPDGANRVYRTHGQRFERRLDEARIVDNEGVVWHVLEDEMVSETVPPVRLTRIPSHRAFWFGWFAQFPQTELFR